jgi:hypothetical protein
MKIGTTRKNGGEEREKKKVEKSEWQIFYKKKENENETSKE